jgi:hypothetical protein
MLNFILFTGLFTIVQSSHHPFSNPFFDWPININITMNKFNSPNCTSSINESTVFILNCNDVTYNNNYRQCCYNELNKLSPFTALVFNSCYTAEYNNSNYMYFNYECSDTSVFDYTLANISIVVFFITIFVLIGWVVIYIAQKICKHPQRHQYDVIN